jgi:hypothetical protein
LGFADAIAGAVQIEAAVLKMTERAHSNNALQTGGDKSARNSDGQNLLGESETATMQGVAQVPAGQNRDGSGPELREDKFLAALPRKAGECESCSGPKDGNKDVND